MYGHPSVSHRVSLMVLTFAVDYQALSNPFEPATLQCSEECQVFSKNGLLFFSIV